MVMYKNTNLDASQEPLSGTSFSVEELEFDFINLNKNITQSQ